MTDGNLSLRYLTPAERAEVYKTRMVRDFRGEEQKPFEKLEALLAEGRYRCIGGFDGGGLAGYMYFVSEGPALLLDYFAVDAERRGGGIGGRMLTLAGELLAPDADYVLAEIEAPESAVCEADRAICERRLAFYARNGFVPLALESSLFGVRLKLEVLPLRRVPSEDETARVLRSLYLKLYDAETVEKGNAAVRSLN